MAEIGVSASRIASRPSGKNRQGFVVSLNTMAFVCQSSGGLNVIKADRTPPGRSC